MVKKILLLISLAINNIWPQTPPTFLYSHGLFDDHTQAYWFSQVGPKGDQNKQYIMGGEVITFDYQDVTPWFWKTDFTQVSMAQTNEIMRMKKIFDETQIALELEGKSTDMILMGVSRGASVILNFMGLFNPAQVKAVIIEAPFDSSATIAKNMIKNLKLNWIPGMKSMSHNLLSFLFVQHKKDGIQAIDSVPLIKKDLPIFIACSLTDWVVPAASTITLYQKLLETGHTQVYLFIAQNSKHSKIIFGSEGDQYTQAVHAFLKKYNLPHDPTMALAGQKILVQLQPAVSKLQKYLK